MWNVATVKGVPTVTFYIVRRTLSRMERLQITKCQTNSCGVDFSQAAAFLAILRGKPASMSRVPKALKRKTLTLQKETEAQLEHGTSWSQLNFREVLLRNHFVGGIVNPTKIRTDHQPCPLISVVSPLLRDLFERNIKKREQRTGDVYQFLISVFPWTFDKKNEF